MDLKWLQDDENISGANECDHFNASFISDTHNQKLEETIKNPYSAVEFSDNLERIFQAIKEGDLEKVKLIVNSHKTRCNNLGGGPEFKWDIINDLSKNWSPFHLSIHQGVDKIYLWFLSQGGDINSVTYDGFSCLNLAVLSGKELMVNLLIGQKGININHVSRKGSSLHIAVLQNNIPILKILLQHPNINLNILNDMQKQPIDLAKGKAKELLEQELLQRVTLQQSQLLSSFISSVKDKKFVNSQNTFLTNRPKKPPIFKGLVQKLHFSTLYSYSRYLIVDPDSGVLARFQNEENAPLNPKEIIPLQSIFNLQIIYEHWLLKKNFTYLLIEFGTKKIYLQFETEKQAMRWFECIRLAAGYSRYIKYKLEQYHFTQEQTKIFDSVLLMLMENANQEIIIQNSIDEKTLDIPEETNCLNTQVQEVKQIFQINFQSFKVIDIVGKGSFGFILKVQLNFNNETYALKQQLKEQLMRQSQLSYAVNELKLLCQLSHPFLIRVLGAFQTPKYLYYLMNYYEKGDLSLYIGKGQVLSENTAKILIAQIILAIEFLHQNNILYRDLKPLNILVGDDGFLKLSDLGLAKLIVNDRQALSFCGSPAYLAPETITGSGVSKSADIYGIGLILYEMLTGYPPHFTHNVDHLLERILYSPIDYDKVKSQTAIKLLKLMLDKNQSKRPTIEGLKQHLFFADIDWNKLLEKSIIPPKLKQVNFRPSFIMEAQQFELRDEDYKDNEFNNCFVEEWQMS